MKAKLVITDLNSDLYWSELECEFGAQDFMHQVNVFPAVRRQKFSGFGGAFTESAARCWKQLPKERADALIDYYFSTDGLGYTLGRAPMGSSDFSIGHYSCADSADDHSHDTCRPKIRGTAHRTSVEPVESSRVYEKQRRQKLRRETSERIQSGLGFLHGKICRTLQKIRLRRQTYVRTE